MQTANSCASRHEQIRARDIRRDRTLTPSCRLAAFQLWNHGIPQRFVTATQCSNIKGIFLASNRTGHRKQGGCGDGDGEHLPPRRKETRKKFEENVDIRRRNRPQTALMMISAN
ncbi:hypothetical protein MRX96_020916 [Rhipicephalus microplus]